MMEKSERYLAQFPPLQPRLPSRSLRHPENIGQGVVVPVLKCLGLFLGVVRKVQLRSRVHKQLCNFTPPLIKGIGYILEEDQPQDKVLVLCRIHPSP